MENIVGHYSDQVHLHSSKYVLKTKTSNNLSQSFLMHISVMFFCFETVTLALSFLSGIRLSQTCSVVNLWQLSLKNLLHSWIKFFPLTVGGSVTF